MSGETNRAIVVLPQLRQSWGGYGHIYGFIALILHTAIC
jgi:hypothetical protein